MTGFLLAGRYCADCLPADWREQLTEMLGARPRRIGIWAELALYGALRCMASAGERQLPATAGLLLSSRHGPCAAMRTLLEQSRDELPMPMGFLQAQPGQALATIAAQLAWIGDARFVAAAEPNAVLRLAAALGHEDGVLIGWVDEYEVPSSVWLRLKPDRNATRAARSSLDFSSLCNA